MEFVSSGTVLDTRENIASRGNLSRVVCIIVTVDACRTCTGCCVCLSAV